MWRHLNTSSVIQNQEKEENKNPADNPFVQVIRKQLASEHKNNFKHKLENKIREKEEELINCSSQRVEEAQDSSTKGSPKVIPYSHKIKTKLIFQDKSPKVWLLFRSYINF